MMKPMESRPKAIISAIDKSFKSAVKMKEGYVWRGSDSYAFSFDDNIELHTNNIIREASSKRSINILDIGTSRGFFIAKNDSKINPGNAAHPISIYGISATDERENKNDIPDEKYILGNAEYLEITLSKSKPASLIKFDFIFSSKTFMHLVDPVDALIQAYNRLAPDGILIVDQFNLPGCENALDDIIKQLRKEGHCIAIAYNNQTAEIKGICIKKTNIPLIFPIEYNKQFPIDKKIYQPAHSLKIQTKPKHEKLYSPEFIKAQKQSLKKKLFDIGIDVKSLRCHSLEDLLRSNHYKTFNLEQQKYLILYMITKELSQSAINNKFFENESPLGKIYKHEYRDLCSRTGNSGNFVLTGDLVSFSIDGLLFKIMTDEKDKLNLIRLAACQNLLAFDIENNIENQRAFHQMNLPIQTVNAYLGTKLFEDLAAQLQTNKNQNLPSSPVNALFNDKNFHEIEMNNLSDYLNRNKKLIPNIDELDSSYAVTCIEPTSQPDTFNIMLESHYSGCPTVNIAISKNDLIDIANHAYGDYNHSKYKSNLKS